MADLNVKISVSKDPTKAQVLLNGVDIADKCLGLNYHLEGGEFPLLTLYLSPNDIEIEDELATVEKEAVKETKRHD